MTIARRRLFQLAGGAMPALLVGCESNANQTPRPRDAALILDIDGKKMSHGCANGFMAAGSQVRAGAPDSMPLLRTTTPEPLAEGWRFSSAANTAAGTALPKLAEFGLMIVTDARDGSPGSICTVADHRGTNVEIVLAASDAIAVWSGRVELMRVRDAAIASGPIAFAVTVDSSRILQCFLNGRYVAPVDHRPVEFAAAQSISLGRTARHQSFTGVVHQLGVWSTAVSGTTLRRSFEATGVKWKVGIAPLIVNRSRPSRQLPRGLKGSCIIPSAADIDQGSAWQNFWSRWDWQWVRDSIDLAVESGSTSIRVIGDVGAMLLGVISPAVYRQRLDQLTTYCKSRGLSVYYCLLDLRHTPLDRLEGVEPLVAMIGRQLSSHSNVVAIELCNEVSVIYPKMNEGTVFGYFTRWAAAIRRETDLPLSISDIHTGPLMAKLTDRDAMARWSEVVDFFDIHVYQPPRIMGPTNYLAPYELATELPLVLGEVGASRDDDKDRVATYQSIERLANSSERVHGVYQWGLINDEYGLMTESGRVRQTRLMAAWRRFRVRTR